MMFTRRTLLVTLTLLASLNPVRADPSGEWPQKPIRIIFPYAAGGVDGWARVITQRVGDALGQPIIIESRPGANGAMAAEAVARLPADGYTLFWAITPQICIFPAMTKVPYDPVRDFAPIS